MKNSEEKLILKYTNYLNTNKNNKLCILSHYDKNQVIENYVKYMVKKLHKLKFDIVFVSTSENISLLELDSLKNYLHTSIIRKNIGYDFISWKTGLSFVKDYQDYESILHINDSIFFPLVNSKKMFKEMNKKKVDFWGMTDSFKQTYHIESFFWVVNQKLIQSDVYKDFWNSCTILEDKNQIIKNYEMGFANLFINHGYKCSAYIPIKKVLQKLKSSFKENSLENLEQKRSFNLFWDLIIKKFNAPFIKKKILIKSHSEYNPTTFVYKEILKKYTSYNINLIENYLKKEDKTKHPINEKANIFFVNLEILHKSMKELKSNKNLVIYGFGEVGYLIYSNLEKNIKKIIDQNYISLSNRYQHINKFHSEKDISIKDEILITAFSREENIISNLEKINIKYKKIIPIDNLLPYNSLKFANNITKLLYNIDSLSRLSIEKKYELFISTSSKNLNSILKNYLEISGIKNIAFELNEEKNSIQFLIFKSKKLLYKSDFTFV
ncbi:rhamnan synthesis F family protein [Aliarcobacter cryaerophilus]|uniref:rhamnan synthesis F family protein n=1 Tax=Aliarcobacter cryaerophilus TaxID=28198 RepID=UPI0014729BF8|nr:rhamnan synthesis F family protein [Aliarcobacter cryaerophilus]